MGGTPKGKRRYSERDWQPYEDVILKQIIDDGGDYDDVAAAVGRTRTGVVLHARKIHYRMMHSTKQLTARDVQRLLGIGDAKTVASWIEKFGWLEARRSGAQTIHRISWPALLAMLRNRMTWMAWSPHKIADETLREWAVKLRKGKSHWISAGDLARRFGVVPAVPQSWIERGDFIPGKTCFKYGKVHGDIEARSQSGDVQIRDAGDRLDVESLSGDVVITGVKGESTINTVSGSVTLTAARGNINIESVSGDLDARDIVARQIRMHTTSGDVSFAGAILDAGRYEFNAFSGEIVLALPNDTGAELSVSTFSGGIESDFPITLKPGEHGIGAAQAKRLNFTVGRGTARIIAETFSGDITLKRHR